MADEKEQSVKVSFKDTLNLPQTDFPMRTNAQEQDSAMIQRWTNENLFKTSFEHNQNNEKFILHDGPPYANGHIHMGGAFNKILKDFIAKSKRMLGYHVPCTPGWDCHGLPIELKVTQENPNLSRSELKKACRAYAQNWIDIQREEFKKLGVLMDWNNPYLTMNFEYEAHILKALGTFVADNYIERKNKTVPWCISCQTVLATAEIEYEDRKDPSLYVQFLLDKEGVKKLFQSLQVANIGILIWTTTPWTLPLNRAIMIKPHEQYHMLEINGNYVLVGAQLVDKVCSIMGVAKLVVATCSSDDLLNVNMHAQHPFDSNRFVPILPDVSVDLHEGTAAVHCAPGAGPQDYEFGIKNNLEIYSPISPDGLYTQEIEPKELVGMSIKDAQGWVINKLLEKGLLVYKTSIKHSYPHCWRCHNGLIFRATKQWFFDLEKGRVKERALYAITKLDMYPEVGRNRFSATIEGRLEWCISRQRIWGVPIPALLCTSCDYTYTTQQFINRVAQHVAKFGIEYWEDVPLEELLETPHFACPSCNAQMWRKETDILDVWFDSGVSHYAVLKQRPELHFPANIYAEGKDQHRGWFQSSLLTSIALNNKTCTRAILTHGFTVDAKGRKMSKSLGNVVSPQEMIDQLGTDGLRLWAASVDYTGDLVISDVLLRNVQEVYRKIRNTCRFLLSNLYDFDISKDAINLENLTIIDHYALQELYQLNKSILASYVNYDFTAVMHHLGDYCTVELSSFYLDIIKDRLYVEKSDGSLRRSTQTACWYILDTLTKLMAPILSFTAEQISDYYQRNKNKSIHLQDFASLENIEDFITHKSMRWLPEGRVLPTETHAAIGHVAYFAHQKQLWNLLKQIRSAILKAIEQKRVTGIIKHSLEAHVFIYFDHLDKEKQSTLKTFFNEVEQSGQDIVSFFKEFAIVSQFTIVHHKDGLDESIMTGLYIFVDGATGHKCPRCWQWEASEHEHNLCSRCQRVLSM